jgi:hypothetical protein
MKKIALLVILAIAMPIAIAQSNVVYSLTIKYDSNALTLENLKLVEGVAPDRVNQPEKGFTLKLISFDGQVLHSFKFLIDTAIVREPPQNIFDESGNQVDVPHETVELRDTMVVLVVPYFENAKAIEIYDESNNLVLTSDVSKYSTKTTSFSLNYLWGAIAIFVLLGSGYLAHKRNVSARIPKVKIELHRRKTKK